MIHASVPVGATLRDRYYEVEHYKRFPVDAEGFEDAVSVVREKYRDYPGHPACVVDLCWDLGWEPGPQGGACGMIGMIERMQVQHLDEAHWERVRRTRDPLPPGKAEVYVRALEAKQCSYDRPGLTERSAICRAPAVSAIETATDNRMWRCREHEGRLDYLHQGKIRLRVLADAGDVDPAFHLRIGPSLALPLR